MDCSFGRHKGYWRKNKPLVDGRLGDIIIPMVVDMGCTQTVIRVDLVPPQLGTPESAVRMICIHGVVYTYERKKLWLNIVG